MQAQAWTAIGLLAATLLGALFYLDNRIDALGTRMDALSSEMRGGFQTQAARLDALAVRVEEQGMQLANRIYELAVKLDDHLRWHAG